MTPTFDTAFCRLVGIRYPIVQAPIGALSTPKVAAAVSEAGGLGMMAMTWSEPDQIEDALARMSDLTDRPFGINLILRWPQEARLRQCLDAGVRIVSFFWGDPAPLIPIAHEAGAVVLHTVGSAAEARVVVDAGVDAVVAQGWEAGGHVWGNVASLPLEGGLRGRHRGDLDVGGTECRTGRDDQAGRRHRAGGRRGGRRSTSKGDRLDPRLSRITCVCDVTH